ncbi:MAG: WD40 repeat domain-containing protein [Planctomycetes bacterium]|nr:WD40 repeat domain-containing protein [Planctomycetota bacterium]
MLQFKGQSRPVTGLAFSPDGATLAACGNGSVVEFWDIATGIAGRAGGPTYFGLTKDNLRYDPSGEWLMVAAGAGLYAIHARGGSVSRVGKTPACGLAVSARGCLLVTIPALISFDVTPNGVGDRKWMKVLRCCQTLGVDFFADSERFASVEYLSPTFYGEPSGCYLRVRSAANGDIQSEQSFGRNRGTLARVSPDGEWVAFISTSYLNISNLTDPTKFIQTQTPNRQHVTGIAFHPSGRYLAATSNDATVRLHDRDAEWTVTRTFEWNIGGLKSVAFSADGNLAAAGGEKGRIVVWDVDV